MPITPARRTLLLSLAVAPLAACGAGSSDPAASGSASDAGGTETGTETPSADVPVTLEDLWTKAAPAGEMTAAFAVLTNTGPDDLVLVGATSPASAEVQLHEMTSDGSGGMSMTQKEGGFDLAAGKTLVFEPGGNHLMFMSLEEDLLAGDSVEITLQFEDGSELPVTSAIRDFTGADESYSEEDPAHDSDPSDAGGMDHEGMEDMDHAEDGQE